MYQSRETFFLSSHHLNLISKWKIFRNNHFLTKYGHIGNSFHWLKKEKATDKERGSTIIASHFGPERPLDLPDHWTCQTTWPPKPFDLPDHWTSQTTWPPRPLGLPGHLTCTLVISRKPQTTILSKGTPAKKQPALDISKSVLTLVCLWMSAV